MYGELHLMKISLLNMCIENNKSVKFLIIIFKNIINTIDVLYN